MIMFILFFYLVNGLMTPGIHGDVDFKSKKPIMCFFSGNRYTYSEPRTLAMDPLKMPKECELIVFTQFDISSTGKITTDTNVLKKLTSLNKTVYLLVYREYRYADWQKILDSDGNATDAKIITDFAVNNNIKGVIMFAISPVADMDKADPNVAKNLIPYLKQLKINTDFGVGIIVHTWNSAIMIDPKVYNYDELNTVVDLYVVYSILVNQCNPAAETLTPIYQTPEFGYGLDKLDKDLRTTSISVDKIYFIIDMSALLPSKLSRVTSYGQVCRKSIDCKTWCIPTTKGYYNEAKFIKSLNYGISTMWLEFDDIYNACGCSFPFAGFQNMVAGYNGAPQIGCPNFDIKSSCPP